MAKVAWSAVFPGKSVCPGEKLIQDFCTWWAQTAAINRDLTAADRPQLQDGVDEFDEWLDDLRNLSKVMRGKGKSAFQRGDYDELMEEFEVKTSKEKANEREPYCNQ